MPFGAVVELLCIDVATRTLLCTRRPAARNFDAIRRGREADEVNRRAGETEIGGRPTRRDEANRHFFISRESSLRGLTFNVLMPPIYNHAPASWLAGCCSRAACNIADSSACSGRTRKASKASARSGNLLEVAL